MRLGVERTLADVRRFSTGVKTTFRCSSGVVFRLHGLSPVERRSRGVSRKILEEGVKKGYLLS